MQGWVILRKQDSPGDLSVRHEVSERGFFTDEQEKIRAESCACRCCGLRDYASTSGFDVLLVDATDMRRDRLPERCPLDQYIAGSIGCDIRSQVIFASDVANT